MVTDSLKPTKQNARILYANNEEVYLNKCFYRKSDNVIAGSALTMIEGFKNLIDWGLNHEQAIHLASTNPAKIMKLETKGNIAPGYDADLVVFDKSFNIMHMIINGKIYEGESLCA